ncbi:MAG: T9SS type A sorting domain-containing protein, partial [Bacteroidetes bacterium]
GTSAACPQVSGVAALILSVNPNLTEQQVREIITSNATDMGAGGKDDLFGWGRVNAALSVAKAYSLAHPQYTFTEGSSPFSLQQSDIWITFLAPPRPDLAAGLYYCDRYVVDATSGGYAQTPQGWYISEYGYSFANPNDASRWLEKTTTSSSVRLKTVFYYIKQDFSWQQINKWAPFDPNPYNLRKYAVLGEPLVPPIISQLTQSPNPVCRDAITRITCILSQGNGNLTYTWTPHDLPAGSNYYPNGNYCDVYISPSTSVAPNAPVASIDCYVSNDAGNSFMYRFIYIDNNCPGCPTLAFYIGGVMLDDNPLLITSMSNPSVDVTDYYLLQNPVTPFGNKINLRIHEPQTEHTWLDYIELIEAKVKSDELVAINEEGEVINYKTVDLPVKVLLNYTIDITEILARMDTLDITLTKGDILTIQRNSLSLEGNGDIVFGGNAIPSAKDRPSVIIRLALDKNGEEKNINDGAGYFPIGELFFRPKKSIIAKKLRNLPPGNLEITINKELTLNYLALVKSLKTVKVNSLRLLSAIHQQSGDVKNLLLNIDHNYAEIFPRDRIDFEFQKGTIPAEKTEYILKSVGRYETDTLFTFNKKTSTAEENLVLKENKLFDNFPNPFNPTTQIKYSVKENGLVTLKVYDVLGNEVAELVNDVKQTGSYKVSFNPSNLASGIYYYKMQAGEFSAVKKLILIK